VLPLLAPEFTACVTDPPYEIGFMNRDFDKTGVSFQPSTWAAVLASCLPGAPLFAFGGCRTYHRLVCAIEDAGWEVANMVLWAFGQGFPKSLDMSKAIDTHYFHEWLDTHPEEKAELQAAKRMKGGDRYAKVVERRLRKAAGAEREVVGDKLDRPGYHLQEGRGNGCYGGGDGLHAPGTDARARAATITAPATPDAKLWDGWAAGLQCLKPALEPICLAQKPIEGTYSQNALAHGVAGLNIDGGRVGIELSREPDTGSAYYAHRGMKYPQTVSDGSGGLFVVNAHDRSLSHKGRWPANLVLSHVPDRPCPACLGDYPACKLCGGTGVIEGCKRVGVKRVKGQQAHPHQRKATNAVYGDWATFEDTPQNRHAASDGLETTEDWRCVEGCPARLFPETKSTRIDNPRNPIAGTAGRSQFGLGDGHECVDYRDSGSAARFFKAVNFTAAEAALFYCPKASPKDRGNLPAEELPLFGESVPAFVNDHPTVKPLALMEYLVTLAKMPERNLILDPFAGSGTTGVACKKLGLRCVLIEQDKESCEIAAERLGVEAADA
jgi:hypothetical protein